MLDEDYGELVDIFFRMYSNSCGRDINLYDDVWVMRLIQFEVPSQTFPFYLQVANMVNVVLHSHKLLVILLLGYFLVVA